MTYLKKCPFCGGEAKLKPYCGSGTLSIGCTGCHIACTDCGVRGRTVQDVHSDDRYKQEATDVWNTRPEQDRLEALNAQLVEDLECIASVNMEALDAPEYWFNKIVGTAKEALEKAKVNDQKEPTNERGIRAMMRDPKYWRERDPEIVKAVAKAFKELYPSKGE